eukprot:GEMP01103372.1.p2 GENE.GEMP01103372.1~~GEMP01103372.1.p2  ORF type:complete len:157 (+),score=14.85 GEMP01103372.1:227-697(+)
MSTAPLLGQALHDVTRKPAISVLLHDDVEVAESTDTRDRASVVRFADSVDSIDDASSCFSDISDTASEYAFTTGLERFVVASSLRSKTMMGRSFVVKHKNINDSPESWSKGQNPTEQKSVFVFFCELIRICLCIFLSRGRSKPGTSNVCVHAFLCC